MNKISSPSSSEKRYFSTFVTGFQDLIESSIKSSLKDVKIILLLDGLIVYTTTSSIEIVKDIPYFNNTFLLIKKFDALENKLPMIVMSEHIMNAKNFNIGVAIPSKYKTFRIIFSLENKMVSFNTPLSKKVEAKIARVTKLELNKANPNVEFWMLYRREGYGFIGMRLTRYNKSSKTREKGELRSEIGMLMALLSDSTKEDTVLDPFAGSGSIPLERTLLPYQKIIISDINPLLINNIKRKVRGLKNITLLKTDAFVLEKILGKESVNKIITDPPWGEYSLQNINLFPFYTNMLDVFYTLLKPNGIAVILVGNMILFNKVLSKFSDKFIIEDQYNTLIAGHKAELYKIRKN